MFRTSGFMSRQKAGINTIGLHANRRLDVLVDFLNRDQGKAFLASCQRLGIQVEYELHAIGDLLSREFAAKDPTLFRIDRTGRRNADSNCCPSSAEALTIIAGKAIEFGRILKPTTPSALWHDATRHTCRRFQPGGPTLSIPPPAAHAPAGRGFRTHLLSHKG